jgi:hypothetical protein
MMMLLAGFNVVTPTWDAMAPDLDGVLFSPEQNFERQDSWATRPACSFDAVMSHPFRHRRHASRYAAIVITVLASLALVGCGDEEEVPRGTDMSRAQLEEQINESFEPDDPQDELKTECEGALEAVADGTQDCRVTNGDDQVGVRAAVTDIEADDLGMVLTPFVYAEDVAGAITQTIEMQGGGYTGVATTCDDDLVGEVGQKLVCNLTSDQGDTVVNVVVTEVDGLMINYDFKSA